MVEKVQLVDDPRLPLLNGVAGFEISTDDPEAIEHFYGELFGWKFSAGHGNPYSIIRTPSERSVFGGLWDNRVNDKAYNWAIICIQVHDVEAACALAVEAGGKLLAPPETSTGPDGTVFAHLLDPSGNQIGIFSRPVQARAAG
jgi:predicted enzyme related to lactoylglutathione lyase